jgi:hypothetical protein
LSRYDVVAFLQQLDHLREQLRWILEIGVHDGHGVARRMIERRSYCDLVTEVAAEE